MKTIVIDIPELYNHFKKIGDRSYEIYLVENYEYPFINISIDIFNNKLKEIYGDNLFNQISEIKYNMVIHSILSIIYYKVNKSLREYRYFKYSKIVNSKDGKLEIEFKYE